jgi:hypothetical protein
MERIVADEAHYLYSSLREKIVEHVLVGEALRALWGRGIYNVEVMRSEFDAHGYDLVMVRGIIVRHIQFKTSVRSKPGRISLGAALECKASGCVVWIQVNDALDMLSFWWLGGPPGEPLPALGERRARRIGRDSQGTRPLREAHRDVNGSAFRRLDSVDQVLEALFGNMPHGEPPVIVDVEGSDEPE